LGRQGWIDTFRHDLEQAKADLADDPPRLVILTGGAARMDFVLPTVREVFTQATAVMDRAPELSIAKGLARFGRLELKSARFRAAILDLFQSGQVRRILDDKVPALLSALAGSLGELMIQQVVIPSVEDWRARRIATRAQLESTIEARSETWLEGPEGRQAFEAAVETWFYSLQPALQTLTDPICERHAIPRTSLSLSGTGGLSAKVPKLGVQPLEIGELDLIADVVNVIVSMLVAKIAGGVGIALLAKGPVDWLVGFIATFGVLLIGKQAAKGRLKEADLWPIVRNRVTDDKIRAQMDTIRPIYAEGLESALREAARQEDLTGRIERQVEAALLLTAEDAVLRFG
jgi:hypothetical protein